VGYVACTQILKESLLIRAQWEVAKLAQLHPPKLINANKRLVYNLICPKVGLDTPAAFGMAGGSHGTISGLNMLNESVALLRIRVLRHMTLTARSV